MTNDLAKLVDLARRIEMSPGQLRKQRQSFVFGNTNIENDLVTRELVAEVDKELNPERAG